MKAKVKLQNSKCKIYLCSFGILHLPVTLCLMGIRSLRLNSIIFINFGVFRKNINYFSPFMKDVVHLHFPFCNSRKASEGEHYYEERGILR